MVDFIIGDKYLSLDTPRNIKNGIPANKEVRIADVSGTAISVVVVLPGRDLKLTVPRDVFGTNFAVVKSAVVMAPAFRSPLAFPTPYI